MGGWGEKGRKGQKCNIAIICNLTRLRQEMSRISMEKKTKIYNLIKGEMKETSSISSYFL
jgi:hypothetical protein